MQKGEENGCRTEPFLEGWLSKFKPEFVIFDPLSDSTITAIDLSIAPRCKPNGSPKSADAPKYVSPPHFENNSMPHRHSNLQPEKKGQPQEQSTAPEQAETAVRPNGERLEQRNENGQNRVDDKQNVSQMKSEGNKSSSTEAHSDSPPPSPEKRIDIISSAGPQPTEMPKEIEEQPLQASSIMAPVKQGTSISFFVESPAQSSSCWTMVSCPSLQPILIARRVRSLTSSTFVVCDPSSPDIAIATISSNLTRLTFKVIMDDTSSESCSIVFKSSLTSDAVTRQFEAFIPRGDDFPGPKKEPILMKPKQPIMKSGIPVLRFGGKVKMESVKNFILISDEYPNRDIFIFGKVSSSCFVGEVEFPLSPFQAFCLCLTQF